MRILMICTNDPAGMGMAFTEAINRYTEHSCRLVTTSIKYNFHYKKDLHVPESTIDPQPSPRVNELERVLRDADVFHFHAFADEETMLGPFRAKDFMRGKRAIYHQHGEPLRSDPVRFREHSARRKFLVSTPDLLELLPEASWIPNLVPVDDPLYAPLPMNEPERSTVDGRRSTVKIGQSPTKKEIKDTALLIRVYAGLKAKHNGFLDLDIIEGTSHSECLERKRKCHIFFDHLQGYYGVSSLEALSQGIPTIAHLSAQTRAEVERFAGTEALPWLTARDSSELESVLNLLITDGDRRREIGKRSRNFMEDHWHPTMITRALLDEYLSL